MASTALQTEIPTFIKYGETLLERRAEIGIRGIDKERSRWNCHLVTAAFANKRLDQITKHDIREWAWTMRKTLALVKGPSRRQTDHCIDRSTILRAYSLMRVLFKEAVRTDLIEVDPCRDVEIEKKASEGDTVEKWSYLTWAEQQAIYACDSIPEHEKLAIRFAIGTGLRHGEQFNLELPDLIVTGGNPRVIVRYSNPRRNADGTITKMPPKSGKRREVALEGDALIAAREWLAMLPSFAPENPQGLVFPLASGARRFPGKPLGRDRSIHNVFREAGIPSRKGLYWHALRHTFATNLLIGVDGRKPLRLAVIQRLMGHSTSAMTERYAHFAADEVSREYRESFGDAKVSAPSVIEETVPAVNLAVEVIPPNALAIPEVAPVRELTPIERLAFGIAGAASRLASKITGARHVA